MLKRMGFCALFAALWIGLAGASTPFETDPDESSMAERLRFDVATFSDDQMDGREAGKRGHDLAAQVMAGRFVDAGLEPLSEADQFLQIVPMRRYRSKYRGGALLFIEGERFEQVDEIIGTTRREDAMLAHAPLVFAGWGLVSDVYGRDDYQDIDPKGAIVVLLKGAPAFLPPERRAFYAARQVEVAAEKGAAAVITILTPNYEREVMSFDRYAEEYLDTQKLTWVYPDGRAYDPHPDLLAEAIMGDAGARRLFENAPWSWDVISQRASTRNGTVQSFAFGTVASMQLGSKISRTTSPNVVGMIPGSDPNLAGEAVVVTAHLDHRGRRRRDGLDLLFRGALNNASGVAVMLEMAKQLKENPPARTVVFAAVTGHEAGLIGSDYLARFGARRDLKVVADVNIDSPLATFPFTELVSYGTSETSLSPVVDRVFEQHGITLGDDQISEHSVFNTSDHFNFVKQGVPSVFLTMGLEGEGRAAFNMYHRAHSHQPTDNIDIIDFDQLARFTDIHIDLTTAIANDPKAPSWDRDSFLAYETGVGARNKVRRRNATRVSAP
ncbi:MAG: M28 family peptidase [Pseudomonadota bacterium]